MGDYMKHIGTVTLKTDRLILRKFNMDDAENMFENWASDENVTRFLTWPTHRHKVMSQQYISWLIKSYEKEDTYDWAIELKEIGQVIGSIGSVYIDEDVKKVQIGYCIGTKWWHKGITSEALSEVIRFFIQYVGVNRVEARFDIRNRNSGKVMEKCGMKYEGTLRDSDKNNSGVCDISWYGILKEEFFQFKVEN